MALERVRPEGPVILDADSFSDVIQAGNKLVIMGNGSDKAVGVLPMPAVTQIPDIVPLAQNMLALAERDFINRKFIDIAYSVPNYLKEFQATMPKKMI